MDSGYACKGYLFINVFMTTLQYIHKASFSHKSQQVILQFSFMRMGSGMDCGTETRDGSETVEEANLLLKFSLDFVHQ